MCATYSLLKSQSFIVKKKIPVPGRDPKEITLHTKKKASLTTPESENLSKKEGLRKQW